MIVDGDYKLVGNVVWIHREENMKNEKKDCLF
jgi:hypothetical protein